MTQRHPIINDATINRMPVFADPACAREAVECLYRVQKMHSFLLYGFVIMPDHCHFLLNVPPPETIAGIMNVYKSGMTFNIGIRKLWQGRYHIRVIRDVAACLHYVHANPVKEDLSQTPEDYPWSSASGRWNVTELDFF